MEVEVVLPGRAQEDEGPDDVEQKRAAALKRLRDAGDVE